MIVISNGQYKSGSTLVYNYNALLVKNQNSEAINSLFKEYLIPILNHIHIEFIPFNIRNLLKLYWFKNLVVLLKMIYANYRYGDFVIKTHGKPDLFWTLLIKVGIAKVTFTYRDPRDIVLSLIDHGEKSRKGWDPVNAFINCDTVENTIPTVTGTINTFKEWRKIENVLFLKYEEIVEEPLKTLKEVNKYLGKNHAEIYLKNCIEAENLKKLEGKSYNFNKGNVNRYQFELDTNSIKLLNQVLKEDLKFMGYA